MKFRLLLNNRRKKAGKTELFFKKVCELKTNYETKGVKPMKKGYQADNIMREERENLEKQLALERRSIQEITTEYLQSKSQIKDDNNP